MTAQQIHYEIVNYLQTYFGADHIHNWYVGITSDVKQRLFEYHSVDLSSKGWIWRQAHNSEHARIAESLLINRGHDGGVGGGNYAATFVYAFRKDPGTVR